MAKGKTRKRKTPSRLRAVLAANVTNRAAVLFKDHPNRPIAIRDASGNAFTKSTAQRIMQAKVGTSLEQLDGLAKALDLSAYQLLIEDLDASSPQIAKGATADEQALYKKIAKEAVLELLLTTDHGTPIKRKP